jgi:hypothetical protein
MSDRRQGAARRYEGTSLPRGWLDARIEGMEWKRITVAGYGQPGRASRTGPHARISAENKGEGIGANLDTVRKVLEGHPELVEQRTADAAKAVGRSPNATVWNVARAAESVESQGVPKGMTSRCDSLTPRSRGVSESESPHMTDSDPRLAPESVEPDPSVREASA